MKGVLKRKGAGRVSDENVPFPGIRHHDINSSPASPLVPKTGSGEDEDIETISPSSSPFPGVRFHLPSSSPPVERAEAKGGEKEEQRFRPLAEQPGRRFAPARPQPYLLSTQGGAASNIGCRETMEDAHAVFDRQGAAWRDLRKGRQAPTAFPNECLSFYAVCDGHAGKTAANVCAEILPLQVTGTRSFLDGNIPEALRTGFKKADEVILATPDPGATAVAERGGMSLDSAAAPPSSASKGGAAAAARGRLNKSSGGMNDGRLHIGQIKELKDMEKVGGTCVAACVVVGHRIFVANVGDCEAVLARWQPDIEQYQGVVLTEKHRVSEKKEKERIDSLGGTVIFGRLFGDLSVTRALGDRDYKKPIQAQDFVSCDPHISSMRLRPEDEFVVMGCDGLWDHVAYDTAIEIVAALKKAGESPEVAAETLVQEALNQHSTDNITCIVVYLNWQRAERPPSRVYMRSNSSTFHKRRSTTANGHNPTPPERVPTTPPSPGWVRSLPRGLSGGSGAARKVKPDKGEASLWRNKSSLGLKTAYSASLRNQHLDDLDKKRVSVVVNWSSLKEEDLEELEDDGWILDDLKNGEEGSGSEGHGDGDVASDTEDSAQYHQGEDSGSGEGEQSNAEANNNAGVGREETSDKDKAGAHAAGLIGPNTEM